MLWLVIYSLNVHNSAWNNPSTLPLHFLREKVEIERGNASPKFVSGRAEIKPSKGLSLYSQQYTVHKLFQDKTVNFSSTVKKAGRQDGREIWCVQGWKERQSGNALPWHLNYDSLGKQFTRLVCKLSSGTVALSTQRTRVCKSLEERPREATSGSRCG